MRHWDLRRWGAVSAGLHAALLVAGALFALARAIPEPEEQGISVELMPAPPQMAQGERLAPLPSPTPDPLP
ncbi:MAG TPA: energy transducer TonB, partial [Acetobacteraceae bacterium]|nr:energy transducer TonB [Acetobacteraceae bacterium]